MGRVAVAAAATAWLGAVIGRSLGLASVIAVAAAAAPLMLRRRRPLAGLLAAIAVAATLSGWLSAFRSDLTLAAQVPEGRVRVAGRVLTDAEPSNSGFRFTFRPDRLEKEGAWVRWDGPRLVAYSEDAIRAVAGEDIVVVGKVRPRPGNVRGDPVAGTISVETVETSTPPSDPLFRAGNLVRARVAGSLRAFSGDPAAALLSGFLIGDIRHLPSPDEHDLRRAGLTHFVAVSGSNVALFLGAWWLVAGPLGISARRRAVVGLGGLALFIVVTRWEPSVVRAATMAGLVLVGRAAGLPIDAWTALGGAVALLILVSAELVADAGFQLSVAATAGVLLGAGFFRDRRPRWAWAALGATLSAQAAVAPLLLIYFGTVPLLAPLSNLVAGPLVALATATGGIGVLSGVDQITAFGVVAARAVLLVARAAAGWPQLGPAGVAGVMCACALAARRGLRPWVGLGLGVWLAMTVALAPGPPSEPTITFLDVGQGDASLLRGPGGETILVDGGPDEGRLAAALRGRGVTRIDLMIVSHRHADHVTGLLGTVVSLPVGRLWHPGHPESGDPDRFDELLEAAAARSVRIEVPAPGWTAHVGEFALEVLGPLRRYDSPNDQSLVVRVEAAGTSVLFPGDVEAIAQRDLGPLPADIMKVPHQGAATSDPTWLAASAGRLAVISVGPNDFGHPAHGVITALEEAGAEVRRTDLAGDVEVRLGEW